MRIATALLLAMGLAAGRTCAQFMDVSSLLGTTIVLPGSEIGKGLSFHDIDRDGWDDLSISMGLADPKFLINTGGQFQAAPFHITNEPPGEITMLLWADHDNDGDADLLILKWNRPIQLWRNDGNWQFTNVAAMAGLEQGNYQYKGAAFGDYDHDGCLDLYISKFYTNNTPGLEYRGMLYRSNCDGTFTEVTAEAGVLIGSAPIFQPVFLDYDNDGWEDLFLVIDRVFHRNELFRNNGDGTFTNVSEASGMDLMIDAMTGTVGDFDLDGDLDVFITADPPEGHALMVNNSNGTFTDMAQPLGVNLVQVGWGCLWLDQDNDGWEDLFVSVTSPILPPIGNQLYRNHQGSGFSAINPEVGLGGDLTETYVCALGDLDRDGWPDFITSNRAPHPVKLYRNTPGENHWFTVALQGVIANRDGVGTWVKCYAGGQRFVRYSLCGSDLMNQNTQRLMFGLGQHTLVDSLILDWNSGTRDVYYNLPVDQRLLFIEGANQGPTAVEIGYNAALPFLCAGGTLELDAGPGFANYLWNTGASSQTILVDQPGSYQVMVTTSFGLQLVSPPLQVDAAPATQVLITSGGPSCFGYSDGAIAVELSTGPPLAILWNNGATGTQLTGLEMGAYSFSGEDAFGCAVFGGVFLNEPQPLFAFVSTSDALCHGEASGTVAAMPFGGTPPYDYDWGVPDPQAAPAGSYTLLLSDANGCLFSEPYNIDQPQALGATISATPSAGNDGAAGIAPNGGTPPYQWIWSTGEENTPYISGLAPGMYHVDVTDANQCMATFPFEIASTIGMEEAPVWRPGVLPNPTRDEVRIRCGSDQDRMDILIMDGAGRVVFARDDHPCSEPVPLGAFRGGRYLLRIASGPGVWMTPLVILPDGL